MNSIPLSSGDSSPVKQLGDSKPIETQKIAQAKELTVLQKWAAQHKVEKNASYGILAPLVALVKVVAGIALVAIAILPVAIAKTYSALSEKYTIYRQPDSPLAAIRKMKKQEETDKLDTMQKVLEDFKDIKSLSPSEGAKILTENLSTRLAGQQLEQNRGARHILRALSQKDPFNPEWMKALNDPAIMSTLEFDKLGIFPESFAYMLKEKYPQLNISDVHSLDWQSISHKVKKRTINPQKIQKEVRIYERSIKDLLDILKNSKLEGDPTSTNQKLIAALRKALTSPVYEAIKEDPTDHSVLLLHRLASDIWNKAPSMDAYRDVGVSIAKKMSISTGNELDGTTIAEQLDESHKKISQLHYTDHGIAGKLGYALTHPFQSLGSMASEGGPVRAIASTLGQDVYDSHGKLANNPSLQGTTTLQLKDGKKAEIRNCYGGSPTIGDHKISPEFKAAIQAAENNQMLPSDLRDKNIPTMVNYNNLQDLDKKHGEGPRSRTIMLLNKKYPLSFRGSTFSKDSAFYKMTPSVDWKGDPIAFGKVMMSHLERSFNPKEKGHGFYFHGTFNQWQPIFKQVINNANEHFEGLKKDQQELWNKLSARDLQGAYQEYVYSLLNSAIEMESVKTLLARGVDSPTVMVITACKENIDRGGMENTKYLYNRLGETEKEDRLPLIIGAMHSRALSARDRIILKTRVPQILSYMKTTSPETFRTNQMKLFASLGYPVSESEYRPYLKKYQKS